MAYTRYMRSFEINNGKVKFNCKIVERGDKTGFLIYLPKFIKDYGKYVEVEIDTIKKTGTIKFF